MNNNAPYFSPVSAKKREQFTSNPSSRKLHLINTGGFCKWKKQLGFWAHYPILPRAPCIYFHSVSLQRIHNDCRNAIREKIKIASLISINSSLKYLLSHLPPHPTSSHLVIQPHCISKSCCGMGWQSRRKNTYCVLVMFVIYIIGH